MTKIDHWWPSSFGPESNWLEEFIERSIEAQLCTTIHCTTCGAMDFRQSLFKLANAASGDPTSDILKVQSALLLADKLSHMKSREKIFGEWNSAISLIMDDLDSVLGKPQLQARLGASLCSAVYTGMLNHSEMVRESRIEHDRRNDPAFIKKYRDEKNLHRQQQHAERMAAKKERDKRSYRQQLLETYPKKENFETEEDFEEALGYWHSHQGRILSMTAASTALPDRNASRSGTDKAVNPDEGHPEGENL